MSIRGYGLCTFVWLCGSVTVCVGEKESRREGGEREKVSRCMCMCCARPAAILCVKAKRCIHAYRTVMSIACASHRGWIRRLGFKVQIRVYRVQGLGSA